MRRRFGFGILGCFVATILVGCGNENLAVSEGRPNESFDNIIILAGNHANSLKPDFDTLDNVLMDVALNYGNIEICVNDGDSYIASSIEVPEQKTGLSTSKKKSIAQSQVEQVIDFLNSEACLARTSELDLLKSFEIASRTIHSSDYQDESNVIYVYDTGINSTGFLDFTEMDLSTVDVDEVIARLVEENLIVDLSDSTVYWYGLCDTAEPQEDLSATQKECVKEFWERYLNEAGATVYFMTDISTEKFEQELPYITPVISVTPSDEWNFQEENIEEFPEAVVFNEESMGFQAGTAELVDEARTEMELQNVVDYMNTNPDFRLLIVGCTARWGDLEDYCKPLSVERCEMIKNLIIEAGISEDRIEIIGMGFENPFYINDQDSNGTLIENLAEDNRCIVLLDATSNLAENIMANTWKE